MNVGVHDSPLFPDPQGQAYHPNIVEKVKCYHCERLVSLQEVAAFPFGYLRNSYNILPTWTESGAVKGRASIPPMIPKNIRGTPMAVPFICGECWAFCQHTDKTVQELGMGLDPLDSYPPF